MQLIWSLIAAALGLAAGLLLPAFSQRLCEYKCKKKNRDLVPDVRFNNWMCLIPCALANGLGWGLCWYFGSAAPIPAILAMLIWSLGVVLIVVDLRLRLIPNEVLLWMLILGVIMQVVLRGFAVMIPNIMISMLVFGLFGMLGNFMGFYKIGAGDAKLAIVMTMSLGYPVILTTLLGFTVSLLVFCLIGLLLRKITLKSYLPLGPFMVPGFWLGLVILLNITL